MTAHDLLGELRRAGFTLDVAGKALLVAPAGRLNDSLRAWIRFHKESLVALLLEESETENFEERAAIMEHDGGLSREEAEAAARALIQRARDRHEHR